MTQITPTWNVAAQSALNTEIVNLSRLGGGDFADSFKVQLAAGRTVFAKTHARPPEGFFTTEATGLSWLRESRTVNVPEVLAVSDLPPYLILEWIDIGRPDRASEPTFGQALAALHRREFPQFGRTDGCTTGSQALPNDVCSNWVEFFASRRLLPLVKIARDSDVLPSRTLTMVESIAARLYDLGGNSEPPSLLHGDLWAGNRVVDNKGGSWLIDPAAHGGHREFDLAMMRLFGGFGDTCFAAYQEAFPLNDGWADRVALHQLAPLMVHAIKFGGHYVSATANAARQYC